MVIKDDDYGEFDVSLGDDGSLDTVICVSPLNAYIADRVGTKEVRFSQEYGANFRDKTGAMTDKGFSELAGEAVKAYIEQHLV